MKKFTGTFKDTEITKLIQEKACEHLFILEDDMTNISLPTKLYLMLKNVDSVKRQVRISITSEKPLTKAVIEHFKRWKRSSLSQSEREELYALYKIKGEGTKVIVINDAIITITINLYAEWYYKNGYDTKVKEIHGRDDIVSNTESIEEFYRLLTC